MKVAILSYPMLFQTRGGLSMKVQRTADALNMRGIEAQIVDPVRDRLRNYDIVHIFAGYNGNHRIVEQAGNVGVPVVLSTILNPPFTAWQGRQARLISRIVGRLTHWEVTTSYQQLATALHQSSHLIALGQIERRMLVDGYLVPKAKISIVHNGIAEEFFRADGELFSKSYPEIPRPFVLHTGLIGEVKNQLGLVRALSGTGIDIVLVGHTGKTAEGYLATCLREGAGKVHYLGELPHGELIASACAAAAVVAIPSRHEGMPNSILEALAADRPSVLTNNHTMDFALPADVACEVATDDHLAIRRSIMNYIARPPIAGRARSLVKKMSWNVVASELESIYRQMLLQRAVKPTTFE